MKDLPQLMTYYRNLMIKTIKRPSTIASKQLRSKELSDNNILTNENRTMINFYSTKNTLQSVRTKRNKRKMCSSLENPLSSINFDKEASKTFQVEQLDSDTISNHKINRRIGHNISFRKSSFITASMNDTTEDGNSEESSKNILKFRPNKIRKRQISFRLNLSKNSSVQNNNVQRNNFRFP